MNNLFQYVLGLAFGLVMFFVVSCNSDSLQMEDTEELAEVSLTISTRSAGADPESQIRSLRLYVYQQDKLVHYVKPILTQGETSYTLNMKLKKQVTDFYVVANEAAAGLLKQNNVADCTLSEKTSRTELENMTFSQLPSDKELANGIVMSGKLPNQQISAFTNLNLTLSRSVARLDLYFVKKGEGQVFMNQGIYLYNCPQYAYVFARNYDGPYAHVESQNVVVGEELHQFNGQILLNEKPGRNNEVTAIFDHEHLKEPAFYQKMPSKSFYIFPNTEQHPGNGYYMKLYWNEEFQGLGSLEKEDRSAIVPLPAVHPNDKVQFFGHVTVNGLVNINFNFLVNPWIPAGADIEFK